MLRNTETRIELTDTTFEAIAKIAEGNPGALTVCMSLLKDGESIDSDNIMGGLGNLLSLDTLGIYGSFVWLLFKDVCKKNLSHMIAVLRAHQLGFLSKDDLKSAIQAKNTRDDFEINVEELCEQVAERLPNFNLLEN